jgi:hypothetical protein
MDNKLAQCKPFLEAMDADDMDTFKQLCEKEVESVHYIVHLEAIKKGKIEFVKYLMSSMHPRDGELFYECAIMSDRPEIVKLFISWSWSFSYKELNGALSRQSEEMVELFLRGDPSLLCYSNLAPILHVFESDPTTLFAYLVSENKRILTNDSYIGVVCSTRHSRLAHFLYEQGCAYPDDVYKYCIHDIELFIFFYEKLRADKPITKVPESIILNCGVEYYEYLAKKGVSLKGPELNNVLGTTHLDVVKYLHENGYKWDPSFPLDNIPEPVWRYCHDNEIPRKIIHDPECDYCHLRKLDMLREYWEMENPEYESLIQWSPRELVDDLIDLLKFDDDDDELWYGDDRYDRYEYDSYGDEGPEENCEDYEDYEEGEEDYGEGDGYFIEGYSMEDFLNQRELNLKRD